MRTQLVFALLGCALSTSWAEFPAIDEFEGFEVDMEPMWIDFELSVSDPTPLDVEGYFRTEMQTLLPNVIGVILKSYDNTEGDTAHTFYTGMAIFQGPPFRTNHEVFEAQTSALTSLKAAASYLNVHNASLGVPSWVDSTLIGEHNEILNDATDGAFIPVETSNDGGLSLVSLMVGLAVGFVIGSCVASLAILWPRYGSSGKGIAIRSPGHKRKVSNQISMEDLEIDDDAQSSSDSIENDDGMEEFHDEESPVVTSPKRVKVTKSNTPLKRRPSHHRRVKSSAFQQMQSPSSVMDGLNGIGCASSNHRRSNSMAAPRRPSVVDLLAVDMAELMNDYDPAEFNDY